MSDVYVQLDVKDIEDILGCINGKDLNGDYFKVKDNSQKLVKDEFAKFVNGEISQRRKKSSISNLREFHNYIKLTLITNIVNLYKFQNKSKQVNLLDIAVGRGGDIFKWNVAGISNVFGFDKSRDSIESINPFNQGARERYKKSKSNLKVNIEFEVGDATRETPGLTEKIILFANKNKIKGFDIMSCQFAMHYFFQNEIALHNVFKMYSLFIKPGGYFIGTSVDGNKISELLNSNTHFESTLLNITKKYKSIKPTKPYNNEYTFKINDSIDQGMYFNTLGESTEYLVNTEVLKTVAKQYGFEPVYINFFQPIPNTFNYTSSNNFISFSEIYRLYELGQSSWKKGNPLTPDELVLNNLYTTFVFQKIK